MKDKKRYLNCKYLDAGMDGMLCSMSLCKNCKEFNGEKCSFYTPKNKMNDKLKPCPFCGNEKIVVDIVARQFDIRSYSVRCIVDIHCNVCETTQRTRVSKEKETDCVEEAIKSWNRRVNENE